MRIGTRHCPRIGAPTSIAPSDPSIKEAAEPPSQLHTAKAKAGVNIGRRSGDTIACRLTDLRPNHVFIIPPQRDLHVLDGEFRLVPISKPRGWPDVITVFLRSLTEHWDGKIIAVIVSGYDGDGAAALCGIKDVGGIIIAQKPETAVQPDMPASALASGCVDFVLSPKDIAREIIRIARAVT